MHKPEERLHGWRISILLFATFLRHSLSRWIIPLNAFWISRVEKKTSTSDALKKCLWVAGDSLFPVRGSSQAVSAQSFLGVAEWIPQALAEWAPRGPLGIQQWLMTALLSAPPLSRAQHKGTSCSLRTTNLHADLLWCDFDRKIIFKMFYDPRHL